MADLTKRSTVRIRKKTSIHGHGNTGSDADERKETELPVNANGTIDSVLTDVEKIVTEADVLKTTKIFLLSASNIFSVSKTMDGGGPAGIWGYYVLHLKAWKKQEYVSHLFASTNEQQ